MSDNQMKIKIELNANKVFKSALMRLRYLMPNYEYNYENGILEITSTNKLSEDEKNKIKKNVNYIFYKEIVYEDNKSIRKKIYESI